MVIQMVKVAVKMQELAITKAVTPSEHSLLQGIELGTIGGMNEFKQVCSKREFDLRWLSNWLGYKEPNKIWKLLKNLEKKGYITREKTQYKMLELIGLNETVFEMAELCSYLKENGPQSCTDILENLAG